MTLNQTVCQNCINFREGKQDGRSVEDETLTPVFAKPAKLLRCRNIINVATFNIKNLNNLIQFPELTASAAKHNIYIACTREHWYYYNALKIKYIDTGKGWIFVTASAWKNPANALIQCVWMLLSHCTLKSCNSIEKKSNREWCVLYSIAAPAQQSAPATVPSKVPVV